MLKVNSTSDAYEITTVTLTDNNFTNALLTKVNDIPSIGAGDAAKMLKVNANKDAFELTTMTLTDSNFTNTLKARVDDIPDIAAGERFDPCNNQQRF